MSKRKAKKPWLSLRNQRDPKRIAKAKQALAAQQVDIPEDEKELLKVVDAKVNGERIGDALLYNDGSVDIKIDEDADPALVEVLRGELNDFNIANDSNLKGSDIGLDI